MIIILKWPKPLTVIDVGSLQYFDNMVHQFRVNIYLWGKWWRVNNIQKCYTTLLIIVEFICYDDACHLKRFANNPKRVDLTEQTKQLAGILKIIVDKMHMRGHTDSWCKENCKFPQLEKVKFHDDWNIWSMCKVHFLLCYRLILKFVNRCSHGFQDISASHRKWISTHLCFFVVSVWS